MNATAASYYLKWKMEIVWSFSFSITTLKKLISEHQFFFKEHLNATWNTTPPPKKKIIYELVLRV